MVYAADTKVPVEQTRTEIERTLNRYGATSFAFFIEQSRAMVVFEANKRRVRFNLPLPAKDGATEAKHAKTLRAKWRALLLCIKAKLESVEAGIETFEEAFLSHVVMPDGQTVGEHAIPKVAAIYKSGTMQALLPAPPKPSEH